MSSSQFIPPYSDLDARLRLSSQLQETAANNCRLSSIAPVASGLCFSDAYASMFPFHQQLLMPTAFPTLALPPLCSSGMPFPSQLGAPVHSTVTTNAFGQPVWRDSQQQLLDTRRLDLVHPAAQLDRDSGNESTYSPDKTTPDHSLSPKSTAGLPLGDGLSSVPSRSSILAAILNGQAKPKACHDGSSEQPPKRRASFSMSHILQSDKRPQTVTADQRATPPFLTQLSNLQPFAQTSAPSAGSAFRPFAAQYAAGALAVHVSDECLPRRLSSSASPASCASLSTSPSSTASMTNALCVVCDDKASGYHYGVISCEGCKGFFRRTVQKGMDYQCHKQSECHVSRVTRNRCQACRYQKCLQMGMSKESVRQDRNRKRKVRDEQEEEEMRATATLQHVIKTVVGAHNETVAPVDSLKAPGSINELLRRELQGGAARVAAFAERVPGFGELSADDRRVLLHGALLEIIVLRVAFFFGGKTSAAAAATGEKAALRALGAVAGRLRDSLLQLQVYNDELALLSAVCLVLPSRAGLSDAAKVEKMQEPLLEALQVQTKLRQPNDNNLFAKLLMKISDIRTVSLTDAERHDLMTKTT